MGKKTCVFGGEKVLLSLDETYEAIANYLANSKLKTVKTLRSVRGCSGADLPHIKQGNQN